MTMYPNSAPESATFLGRCYSPLKYCEMTMKKEVSQKGPFLFNFPLKRNMRSTNYRFEMNIQVSVKSRPDNPCYPLRILD